MPLENKVGGERERKAKKGLSKAHTVEAFKNLQRAVKVSLATAGISDNVPDALDAALTALHSFDELGRGTATVSSTYIKSNQTQVTASNPVYFLKGNTKRGCFSWVHFRANSMLF